MRQSIAIQGPENGGSILRLIKKMAAVGNYDNLIGLYAYATDRGVQLLTETLKSELSTWDKIYKRWVISIDFGFTEPCALKKLLCMPNTECFRKNYNLPHVFMRKV